MKKILSLLLFTAFSASAFDQTLRPATQAQVNAGSNNQTAVTPKTLKAWTGLNSLISSPIKLIHGTNATPYSTIALAAAAAVSGDTIKVSGVTFVSNAIVLNSVNLVGDGSTIITNYVELNANGVAFVPNNSLIKGITFYNGLGQSAYSSPFGSSGVASLGKQTPMTNGIVEDCTSYGDSDGFYVQHTNNSGRITRCRFYSKYDTAVVIGGNNNFTWEDCYFYEQPGPLVSVTRNFLTGGPSSTNILTRCTFEQATNASGNMVISLNGSGGNDISILDSKFLFASTNNSQTVVNMGVAGDVLRMKNIAFLNLNQATNLNWIRLAGAGTTARLIDVEFPNGMVNTTPILSTAGPSLGSIVVSGGNLDYTLLSVTTLARITSVQRSSLIHTLFNNTTVPTAAQIGTNNTWIESSNGVPYTYSTVDGSTLSIWTPSQSILPSQLPSPTGDFTNFTSTTFTLTGASTNVLGAKVITLTNAGTYLITGSINLEANGTTFVGNAIVITTTFQRTNNTPSAIGPSRSVTANSFSYGGEAGLSLIGIISLPPLIYVTTNSNDIISIYSKCDVLPSIGSIQVLDADVEAMRIN